MADRSSRRASGGMRVTDLVNVPKRKVISAQACATRSRSGLSSPRRPGDGRPVPRLVTAPGRACRERCSCASGRGSSDVCASAAVPGRRQVRAAPAPVPPPQRVSGDLPNDEHRAASGSQIPPNWNCQRAACEHSPRRVPGTAPRTGPLRLCPLLRPLLARPTWEPHRVQLPNGSGSHRHQVDTSVWRHRGTPAREARSTRRVRFSHFAAASAHRYTPEGGGTKGRGEGSVVSEAELLGPLRTLLQRAGLAVSLAVVLGVTLSPVDGPNHVALAPWGARQLSAVNVVGNIALFALPAAVIRSFGWSLRRTVVAGFVLSLGIELLQLAIPGRTTATADVLCNTLGAAAGWLVAASLGRRPDST
jgi:VanZ like protein